MQKNTTADPGVLVINPDIEEARPIRVFLEKNGYMVSVAATGREGLSIYRSVMPDIILLDTTMEDMHFLDVCRTIAENEHWKSSVIIITGFQSLSWRISAFIAGAAGIIFKPLNLEQMMADIEHTLIVNIGDDRQVPQNRPE